MTPLQYISFIHEILPITEYGFEIQCFAFHRLLKTQFPEALPYYNGDHVVSLIEGELFDMSGLVEPDRYLPMEEFYGKNWIEFHKSKDLLLSYYKERLTLTLNNHERNYSKRTD